MSYARFGEASNVYVYAHVGGFIECCACSISDEWSHHSREAIVQHMHEHVAAGHLVAALGDQILVLELDAELLAPVVIQPLDHD